MSYKNIYGPLPSRRLGNSVGVSPIPAKACNYSCGYCQLGRTDKMTVEIKEWFPLEDILAQVDQFLASGVAYDVLTVVGEGEPTLYSRLKELLLALKAKQPKPVCVITNAANIDQPEVRDALMEADIVLPSLDTVDEEEWRKLHRPSPHIRFQDILSGLVDFSGVYRGEIWLELMLVKEINDSPQSIDALVPWLEKIRPDRVYINTPVRPPAEADVEVASPEAIAYAVDRLKGIAIDQLTTGFFDSAEEDPIEAIRKITIRHPMTEYEIRHFWEKKGVADIAGAFVDLAGRPGMKKIDYKGLISYLNAGGED